MYVTILHSHLSRKRRESSFSPISASRKFTPNSWQLAKQTLHQLIIAPIFLSGQASRIGSLQRLWHNSRRPIVISCFTPSPSLPDALFLLAQEEEKLCL